jgi:hypothetical protein
MRLRLAAVLAVLGALGVTAPSALAANSISVDAPAQASFGDSAVVHVAGNSDVANAIVAHFVQKEDCPATYAQASVQPNSPPRSPQGFPNPGPFAFDQTLPMAGGQGQGLEGLVKVCVYLYTQNADGSTTTLAFAIDVINVTRPTTGATFGPSIAAHPRMSASGTIPLAFTCPLGCNITVTWKGLGRGRTVSGHIGKGTTQHKLQLNPATQKRVKLLRRKGSARGVPVKVDATATQRSPRKTAHLKTTVGVR